jgi:general secretion pathway protein M
LTPASRTRAGFTLGPGLAALIYAVVLGLLLLGSVGFLADLWSDFKEVGSARAQLASLAQRSLRESSARGSLDARTLGSPFLEGATITIAGATLQQRVQEAVAQAGGVLSSSQVDFDGPEGIGGSVHLTATVEAPESAVQAILYDLEAGMPFLFVDKLSLQSPRTFGEPDVGKMRMTIGVAGQWQPSE